MYEIKGFKLEIDSHPIASINIIPQHGFNKFMKWKMNLDINILCVCVGFYHNFLKFGSKGAGKTLILFVLCIYIEKKVLKFGFNLNEEIVNKCDWKRKNMKLRDEREPSHCFNILLLFLKNDTYLPKM